MRSGGEPDGALSRARETVARGAIARGDGSGQVLTRPPTGRSARFDFPIGKSEFANPLRTPYIPDREIEP